MLRKRTRSHQKDQHMNNLMHDAISESYFHSDMLTQKHKNNSFLSVPGLFVGFNPRSSESDSARSPTSPLDFRIFSSFGNPFRRQRSSQNEGYQKSWDCNKVGLRIIDSLDDESNQLGNVTRSSDNKSIVFGRQMSIRALNFCSSIEAPKSLPENVAVFPISLAKPANLQKGSSDVVFEIGETLVVPESRENFRARSLDSGRYGSHLMNFGNCKSRFGSGNLVPESKTKPMPVESGFLGGSHEIGNNSGTRYLGSIPASEIELSEDYTCVRTHGPNPKVTHIFGDCILGCQDDEVTKFSKKSDNNPTHEADGPSDILAFPPDDFLKFCYSCHKKLDGEDIYMYRGEKAFCSYACRSQEIEIDEEMEKMNSDSLETSDKGEEISKSSGLFITTT